MPSLKQFDEAAAALRDGVAEMPARMESDGLTAIRHEDDATGEIDCLILYAWGESARVINRVLKLAPGQTPKPVRDSH